MPLLPRPVLYGERVMAQPCFQHEVRGGNSFQNKRPPLTLTLSPFLGHRNGERASDRDSSPLLRVGAEFFAMSAPSRTGLLLHANCQRAGGCAGIAFGAVHVFNRCRWVNEGAGRDGADDVGDAGDNRWRFHGRGCTG